MVHRILQDVLDGRKPRDQQSLALECRRSSEREKAAAMAERASVKYKQIEMLLQNPPETVYQGLITDFRESGMFIEIAYNYADGFVRYSDMKDDQYGFEKREYEVIGRRWGTVYRLGQHVQVLLKKGDLRTRQIDWMLINHEEQEKNPGRPVWKADRRKRR
jgi:ribonuclease R